MRSPIPTPTMIVLALTLAAVVSGCQKTPPLKLPPLQVAGWINAEPDTENGLKGKVVVLDFFATWCGPCQESTPELIQLYTKYHEQGVQFIGLTYEDAGDLDLIQSYVDNLGIEWPVGYHAIGPSEALRVEALPTVMVFDSQGQLILNQVGYDPGSDSIDQSIQAALTAQK